MKNRVLGVCLLVFVMSLLAPSPVWAATEGHAGWGWLETIGRWINLFILFGGIFYFVREPAARFFAKRREEIRRDISRADRLREESQAQLEAIKKRVENLDAELEMIRGESEKEADLERQSILNQADREAEKVLTQAKRQIEGMGRAVRKDLKSYAAQLAVELAEGKIKKDLAGPREEELEERFLTGLTGARKSS